MLFRFRDNRIKPSSPQLVPQLHVKRRGGEMEEEEKRGKKEGKGKRNRRIKFRVQGRGIYRRRIQILHNIVSLTLER